MRRVVAGVAAMGVAMLASCGGGGSDGDACNAVGVNPITTTWAVTGGEYNPPRYAGQIVVGRVGVALSARPVHANMLPSCVGKGVYSLGSDAAPLPAGLSLNAATGEISGTPTAMGDTNAGAAPVGAVRLTFPGLTSLPVLTRLAVEK